MPSEATLATRRKRSIAEIETDLAKTREELTSTLHELAEKVNPKPMAAHAVDRTKAAASSVAHKPMALGLIALAAGVAVAAVILGRRLRS